MFDVTIQAMAVEITNGEDHVLLSLIMGLSIPVGQGPQGIVMGQLPAGAIRVPMGREPAIEHGTALKEAGESLPEPEPEKHSDIVVAQSLAGVDQAARQAEAFRQGNAPRR